MSETTKKYPFCTRCGASYNLEAHHAIFRSQGGSDDEDNLLSLCHDCHQALHHHVFTAWRKGDTVFISEAGVIRQVQLIPYEGAPHELTDVSTVIANWLEPDRVAPLLKDAPNEVLQEFYTALIRVRESAWQIQCLIVSELMSRSTYGAHTAEGVATQLNMKPATVYYRNRVADLLKDPEVIASNVGEVLTGEAWYRVASGAKEPKEALIMAADRKAANPSYSARQFQAELRNLAPHSLTNIILVCSGNDTDRDIARALEREYGVPVNLNLIEQSAVA